MPDGINGIFFENQILTAKGLGAFGNSALSDGILTGCKVSVGSNVVTIDEGYIIICGRVIRIPQTTFTIPSSSGGATVYHAIVATVDTTAISDESSFEQVSLSVSSGNSDVMSPLSNIHSGYDSTNQFIYDINMSGNTASMWLVLVRVNSTTPTIIAYNYAIANSMDLLWKNPSPTSAFDGSTFATKFPTLSKYDAVLITYRRTNESSNYGYYRSSLICPFGDSGNYTYTLADASLDGSSNYTIVVRERDVTITPSTGTITFSTGWRSGGSSGSTGTIIPLEIYGLRAGISY